MKDKRELRADYNNALFWIAQKKTLNSQLEKGKPSSVDLVAKVKSWLKR